MKEDIFVPKYNYRSLVLFGVLVLTTGAGMIWFGTSIHSSFMSGMGSGVILLSLLSLLFGNPKLMIFQENGIVVKRTLMHDLALDYGFFSGIDKELVRFGNKVIPLTFLSNSDELRSVFTMLLENGKIMYPPQHQFDWWLAFRAFRVSFPVAFLLTTFGIIIFDLPNLLSIYFVNCVLFLGLFSISYLLIRNREITNRKKNTL